jgi:oligoendopeptidase F
MRVPVGWFRSGSLAPVIFLCALPGAHATGEPAYRIDLERHFFVSPAAEQEGRQALQQLYTRLEALKGNVGATAGNLLSALRLQDEILIEVNRHANYLYLRASIDERDEASAQGESDLFAELSSRTAFLHAEIRAVTALTLSAYIATEPALSPYRHAIEEDQRNVAHSVPLPEEELLGELGPLTSEWQGTLYGRLLSRTDFGKVDAPEGALDLRRQRSVIAAHADPRVREAGFRQRYAALAQQRDLFAFTLTQLARSRNRLAALHHFDDAPSEAYFASSLTRQRVTGLLETLAAQAEVYKGYQRQRAEEIRAHAGLQQINVWDDALVPGPAMSPHYSVAQAAATIHAAVEPLGARFADEMSALLDPRNGRMDLGPGEHRARRFFSSGFIGTDSVFYAERFAGEYNDMRVLAHEGTHAVHRQLMKLNRVLPVYAEGPHFLFESFASFTELLLADSLYARAKDPALKRFFLDQFLQGKGTVMFVAGAEAALEQAVYERVAKGEATDADALDELARTTLARYSIWPEINPEMKQSWMNIRLMFEDPFYDLNYVYAGLLALAYLDLYQENPRRFGPRYVALLEHGFDATPDELLSKYLGIELDETQLTAHAIAALKKRIALRASLK